MLLHSFPEIISGLNAYDCDFHIKFKSIFLPFWDIFKNYLSNFNIISGPSNMVLMQENVPIGFNYILQDYHGEIQDYKQALDSYFDAFSLLLGI